MISVLNLGHNPRSASASSDADAVLVHQEIAREGILDGGSPVLQPSLRPNELSGSGSIQRAYALPLSEALVAGLRRAGRIVLQLALIWAVCLAGEKVADALPVDIPGNICAMVLLLVFLISGVIRMESISEAADFLLDNMAVFFIPAAVAIMGSVDILAGSIIKLVVICLITTVLVFFVTSFTVSAVAGFLARREARSAHDAMRERG